MIVIYQCLLMFDPDTFIFCSSNCLDKKCLNTTNKTNQLSVFQSQFFSPRNLSRKVLQKNTALCIMLRSKKIPGSPELKKYQQWIPELGTRKSFSFVTTTTPQLHQNLPKYLQKIHRFKHEFRQCFGSESRFYRLSGFGGSGL